MPAKLLSSARRAFTIVELLVAIAVTALLVTLMVTITINVLSAWNRSSGNLSAGNQARLVLDQLSQDLQGAIIRRDAANAWLVATVQRDQSGSGDSGMANADWAGSKPGAAAGSLLISPTSLTALENPNFPLGIENYRFGQAGVWLRFFTTPSDNTTTAVSNASAPRAVSYQLVRRRLSSSSSDRAYMLYRSEVRPAHATTNNSTFGVGYNLLMDEEDDPSYNSGPGTDTDDSKQDVGRVRRPHPDYLIANDVVDFGIKLYGRDASNAEIELFPVLRDAAGVAVYTPSGAPFSFAVSSRAAGSPVPVTGVAPVTYGYPTAADVMVRILTPQGVRLIQAIEQGTLEGDWWETVLQNSHVYTRRIEIKSKGL